MMKLKGSAYQPLPKGVVLEGSPDDFIVNGYWAFVGLFKGEAEEALARFMILQQDRGEWCSVEADAFANAIQQEVEEDRKNDRIAAEVREQNQQQLRIYAETMANYDEVLIRWAEKRPRRRGPRPQRPVFPRVQEVPAFSATGPSMFALGADYFLTGISWLHQHDYLVIEQGDDQLIMYLTPAALEVMGRFKREPDLVG